MPEEYLPAIAAKYPGALESQWIPMDPELWKIPNYPAFLEARQVLLTEAANALLDSLYRLEEKEPLQPRAVPEPALAAIPGGIASEEEERVIDECLAWLRQHELPQGESPYELTDSNSGEPLAMLDVAWPEGLQTGFSEPVALLLDEPADVILKASQAGFRCFRQVSELKHYVIAEILHHDLLALADSRVHEDLINRLEQGWPIPEIGYELQNEQGEIVTEVELAWPDRKVAVLVQDEGESGAMLRSQGWTVVAHGQSTSSQTSGINC